MSHFPLPLIPVLVITCILWSQSGCHSTAPRASEFGGKADSISSLHARLHRHGLRVVGRIPAGKGVTGVAVSRDGAVAAWTRAGELTLWSLSEERILWSHRNFTTRHSHLAFSPDGSLLASAPAGEPGPVAVWSVLDGRITATREATESVVALTFDNTDVVYGTGMQLVRWPVTPRATASDVQLPEHSFTAAIDVDRRRVVTVTHPPDRGSPQLVLFNLDTGSDLLHLRMSSSISITSAAWLDADRVIVTGWRLVLKWPTGVPSYQDYIEIYDVAARRRRLHTESTIERVARSSGTMLCAVDGRYILLIK